MRSEQGGRKVINDLTLLLIISLSFALGSKWLGQPFLLGYVLTGICLGPFFSHASVYSDLIDALGEFGLLMLIFHIGIEFNLNDFKRLWKKAIAIFSLQLLASLFFGIILYCFLDFNIAYSLMCSFLLVLSSTAVVIRLLEEMDELDPRDESLIVSVLIFQDLAIVPMSIILNGVEGASFLSISWKVMLAIMGLCLLIHFLSHSSNKAQKFLRPLMWIFDGNQEIMTLASLAMCFSFSSISYMLGFSHSYGPFLAGLILGALGKKHQILSFSRPIGSILLMSFFIFVGTNIDITYIKENYLLILLLTVLTLILKIAINYGVLRFLKYDKIKSFFIAIVLSQASEFSFSFLGILLSNKSINVHQYKLITTLCIISLTLGSVLPLFAQYIKRMYDKVKK